MARAVPVDHDDRLVADDPGHGRAEILSVGGTEIGRLVFEPGWRWAESTCELVAIAVVDVSPGKA